MQMEDRQVSNNYIDFVIGGNYNWGVQDEHHRYNFFGVIYGWNFAVYFSAQLMRMHWIHLINSN